MHIGLREIGITARSRQSSLTVPVLVWVTNYKDLISVLYSAWENCGTVKLLENGPAKKQTNRSSNFKNLYRSDSVQSGTTRQSGQATECGQRGHISPPFGWTVHCLVYTAALYQRVSLTSLPPPCNQRRQRCQQCPLIAAGATAADAVHSLWSQRVLQTLASAAPF